MCFYGWMHKILMRKIVTLYFPGDMNIYYAVHRFYYFHITRSYKAYSSHTNHTYLEQFLLLCTDDNLLEGSYSIHRKDSHGKTGLRLFGSTSSISTWC